jgi:alkylation response protein AidB-like acyl-CoA dehydrogenase
VNPTFTDDELAFRSEVRDFLATQVDRTTMQFFRGRGGKARELYRALGARGWLSLTWPVEHGGRALPETF